ncbi:MAG TPA: putative Ig domain-containing protein [Streptosporangiaceae bacterium]|nr:putative Ig domain-containing protein [Streptosporangiaceae bacterium]
MRDNDQCDARRGGMRARRRRHRARVLISGPALAAVGALTFSLVSPVSAGAASRAVVTSSGLALATGGVNVPAIAVDPATHTVWAAVTTAGRSDYVEEISETTRAVLRKIQVPAGVDTVAVDAKAGLVWVGSLKSQILTEIVESTGSTRTVDLSAVGDNSGISAVAVDPATGKAFAVTLLGVVVSVVEGTGAWRIITTVIVGGPAGMTVDPSSATIWISDDSSTVRELAETGVTIAVIFVGSSPFGLAADPVTRTVWVANQDDKTVQEIDEPAEAVVGSPVPVGHAPVGVAVSPGSGTVWVVNFGDGTMSQIDEATASVTGTLSAGAVRFPYSVAADTGNGQVFVGGYDDNFDGVVTAFLPAKPSFTSPASAWFAVGGSREDRFTFTTAGFPAPAFSVTSPGTPGWLTLDPMTGVLSGTPPGTDPGGIPLTVTASNSQGAVSQKFTLRLGSDPVFRSRPRVTFVVGVRARFALRATGVPAPAFRVLKGALPAGLRLSAAGVLSGTAVRGAGGIHQLRLGAVNPLHRTVLAFTLVIDQVPRFTTATRVTTHRGRQCRFTVRTTGFPVAVLRVRGRLPMGLRVRVAAAGTAVISGVPARSDRRGRYTITFTASNGVGRPVTQILTIVMR